MKRLLTRALSAGLLCTALLPGAGSAAPKEKIGVIIHDHGAPLTHNAVSYYGMKWFMDELVNMNLIPAFVRDGFPFDPNQGKWGVILMDRNRPYTEVPWAALELIDAWGNDQTWLKHVDKDPSTPAIDPVYQWVPAGSDMYGNRGHYLLPKTPYSTTYPSLLGWSEPDFFEFAGFDFYAGWQKKGGVEVYFDQVQGQRQAIRDVLWKKHRKFLTASSSAPYHDAAMSDEDKEMHIVLTNGIDFEFPNTDPATSRHAQSLYDAVMMLVMDHGVRKIVVSEYFMFLSQMMNDEMDRMTVMDALMDLEMMGYTGIEILWAPDKLPIGEFEAPIYQCSQWPPSATEVGTETRTAYVGGIAFHKTFLGAVSDQAVLEFAGIPASSGDIAFFLSNHGTATKRSFCFDSAHDYIHNSYKAVFVQAAERISHALAARDLTFGPDPLGEADLKNLLSVDTLGKNIQYATARLKDGRTLKFFRTSGQAANSSDDPQGFAYSPREALFELVNDNAAGASFSHVVDLLYNFFGDSGDLLIDHRLDGYGNENEADPLYLAAWRYCNPNVPAGDVHDCSLPEYAGLAPYETEFDWSGIHVRVTNASWAFDAKEKAAADIIGDAILKAATPRPRSPKG